METLHLASRSCYHCSMTRRHLPSLKSHLSNGSIFITFLLHFCRGERNEDNDDHHFLFSRNKSRKKQVDPNLTFNPFIIYYHVLPILPILPILALLVLPLLLFLLILSFISAEFYLGYSRQELVDVSWYQLLHWDFMREAQSKHRLSKPSIAPGSLRLRRRNMSSPKD